MNKEPAFGSGISLALISEQAIIWTNDGLDEWP